MADPLWLDHNVIREDRDDGTILLGSGIELGPVARNTGQWLHEWAQKASDRVFLGERRGDDWREVSYGDLLLKVRAVATGLIGRNLGSTTPIVILSGPSIDHAILSLAAQYIGAPVVPLAEQYSLVPAAHGRLAFCVNKVKPALVYAQNATAFADALALPIFDDVEKVVSDEAISGMTEFASLLSGEPGVDIDAAHAEVGPDTIAKILFTSGSTSDPKGVPQTQKMMCVNQAQYKATLPILTRKHHTMLDWLPWNHVFAGSNNFNMILALGGSLYLDDGKPVGPLAARSLENLRDKPGSLAFNVPVGHAMQIAAMEEDRELRSRYFDALDIFFYAGASLPADVWSAMERLALEEIGEMPMMMSSWGMTETAPSALIYHEKGASSGMIGVPVPRLQAKLAKVDDNRFDLRVRGPNVFDAYFDDPERSAESFDDEGFFITGDAVSLVDPDDASRGVLFEGRLGEDFKLTTGVWVHASTLRLLALAELSGLAQDAVIVGEGRDEIGLLVFPSPSLGLQGEAGAIVDATVSQQLRERLGPLADAATGSSNRIARALIMAEPPDVGAGEITAKGSLNVHVIVTRRVELIDRLYNDNDPAAITI